LRFGIKEQQDLGGVFELTVPALIGHTHSRSIDDLRALAGLLQNNGWLSDSYMSGLSAQVTPQGFMHATETNISQSVNGFIAMWFNKSMHSAHMEGLEPAIRDAGYNPIIVSGVEHVNKIDDEIVSQIRRSKFLVADFTGHRGGVYFEAGFAMGLGIPVFWTCRQDMLENLHFDIRQYNCIDWADPASLRTRLTRRIEAVLGRGPIATPQS
jgi:nucleoside 2-deoxyribosyltransferase